MKFASFTINSSFAYAVFANFEDNCVGESLSVAGDLASGLALFDLFKRMYFRVEIAAG